MPSPVYQYINMLRSTPPLYVYVYVNSLWVAPDYTPVAASNTSPATLYNAAIGQRYPFTPHHIPSRYRARVYPGSIQGFTLECSALDQSTVYRIRLVYNVLRDLDLNKHPIISDFDILM